MPVVSEAEFLKTARKGRYAVGGYNTGNLEWTQTILEAAEAKKVPVLIQTSMGAAKRIDGYKIAKDMITNLVDSVNIAVPVAIYLDHGDYKAVLECIKVGHVSITSDGSHLPFEENLKLAKDVVERAHARGISVEREVGSIGDEEDGIIGTGELVDIKERKQMVATGINYLAYGIDSIYGQYPKNWRGLAPGHLQTIVETVGSDVPLVLHGGSGIPQEQTEKAISMDISKVNVNTEFQLSFVKVTREHIEAGKDLEGKGSDPCKLLVPGKAAVIKDIEEYIDWFGSANRA